MRYLARRSIPKPEGGGSSRMLSDEQVLRLLIQNCERVAAMASPTMRADLEAWLKVARARLDDDVVAGIPRRPVTRPSCGGRPTHLQRVV